MIEPKKNLHDFLNTEPGKKKKLEKVIRILYFLLMLLFISIGIYTYRLLQDTGDLFVEVITIRESISYMNNINLNYANKSTSSRAYSFSRDEKYVEQYKLFDSELKKSLDSLRVHLSEIQMSDKFDEINDNIAKTSVISDSLMVNASGQLKDSVDILNDQRSRLDELYMQTVRFNLNEISKLSQSLQNTIELRSIALNDTTIAFALMIIFGTLTLVISLIFFGELTRSRERAYDVLKKAFEDLDQVVLLRTNELEKANQLLSKEIDTRNENEILLKESEERFRIMAESAPVLIWMSDRDMNSTYLNNRWFEFTGRTPKQESGLGWLDNIHPEDKDRCMTVFREAYEKHIPFEVEFRLRDYTGDYCWLYDKGTPRFHNNELVGFIGVCVDVNEMKKNEKYLRIQYTVSKTLSEAVNARNGLQSSLDTILKTVDWDFGILWTVDDNEEALTPAAISNNTSNQSYNELHNTNFKFTRGHGLPGVVWDTGKSLWVEDIENSNVFIRRDAVTKMSFNSAFAIPIYIGNEIVSVIECFSSTKSKQNNDLMEFLETVGRQLGNFVERKKAEDKLRESNLQLEERVKERTIELANTLTKLLQEIEGREKIQSKLKLFAHSIKSIKEAVYITDLDNKLIFVNEAFEYILGYRENEILDKEMPLLSDGSIEERLKDIILKNTLKGGWKGEFVTTRKDGAKLYIHLSTSVIRNEEGRIEAIIGICNDITESKETEALIEKRNSLLNLLNDVIKVTNKTFEIDNSIQYAVNKVCSYTSWDAGHCYLLQDGVLKSSGIWSTNLSEKYDKFKEVSEKTTFARGQGMPGKCLEESRPLWVKSDEFKNKSLIPRAEVSMEVGFKTGIWCPIVKQNEVVGVLEFFNCEDKILDYEMLDCIDNIGIEIGNIFERVEILDKISESQERFKALAETANDAIITTNSTGEIIYVNKAAGEIFNFSENEFNKLNIIKLISERNQDDFRFAFNQAVNGNNTINTGKTVEMLAIRSNGEEFPVEISLANWYIENDLYFTAMVRDITERKYIEKQLREKQKMLEDAQHIAKLGSWDWDVKNDKLYWSDELWKIFEIEKDSIPLSFESYIMNLHPEDQEIVRNTIMNAFETKTSFEFYHRLITPDNTHKILKGRGEVFVDDKDNVIRMFGTALDVTEVREAEERIRENERKLRDAQKIAKLGSWEWNYNTKEVFWSDEMFNIFEVDPEETEITNELWQSFVVDEDKESVKENFRKIIREKIPVSYDYRIVTSSGKEKYLNAHGDVKLDERGNILYLMGIVMDVTNIREAEFKLRMNEQQLKEAQKIAKMGSFVWDIQSNKVNWSDELYRIFEVNSDVEPSIQLWESHVMKEDLPMIKKIRENAIREKKPYTFDFRIKSKNGIVKNVTSHAEIYLDERENIRRVVGTVMDVTELRKAEENVRRNERQLKEAQRIARLGSWVTNYVTGERFWSDELYRIYELEETDEIPKFEELTDIIHPADREMFNETIRLVMNDLKDRQIVYRIISANGREKYIGAYIIPELDENNNLIRLYGIAQDITDTKEKEEQIINSERQLKEAQKIAKIGSWVTNYNTEERFWSDELYRLYEIEQTNKTPKFEELTDIIHPADRKIFNDTIQEVMSTLQDKQVVYRIIPDGKEKYINAYIIPELNADDKLLRLYGIAQDITDTKAKEEHIINSERQLREAQRLARIGSWVTNYATGERFWSDELYHIYELDPDAGTPKFEELTDIIHPSDRELFDETIMQVMTELTDKQIIYRIIPPSGKEKYISAFILPELDENNNLLRLYGIAQDITDTRKKDEHIINSERQLREAQRISRIGSWVTNYVSGERFWSEELYHIYELEENDEIPKFEELTDIIHPLDRNNFNETIAMVMNDLRDRQIVYRIIPKSGKEKYIGAYIIPELDKNNKLIRLYGIAQDISESRMKEEHIVNSERQLREAQRIAKIGSWVTNYVTEERFWSEELYHIYELDPDAGTPKFEELTDIIHPSDRELFNETILQVMTELKDKQIVYRIIPPSGIVKYISASILPELDENSNLLRLYGIAQDITDTRKKDEHIINSERQLREAQRISRIGSWVTNYVSGERFWSEELYHIYELEENGEIPKFEELTDIIHPLDRNNFNETIAMVMKDLRDRQIEYRIIPESGKEKYIGAYIIPELDKNNKLIRLYGIAQDITDTKAKEEHIINSERQLREAQRLARIGSWVTNYVTEERFWSEELYHIYELDPDAGTPKFEELTDIIHPADRELFDETIRQVMTELKDKQIVYRIIPPSGIVKYISAFILPELDENNNLLRLYGIAQDITDTRKKDEHIINSERQLREAQRISRIGSWVTNYVSGERFWSEELYHIYELEENGEIPKFEELTDIIHPLDRDNFNETIAMVMNDLCDRQIVYRIIPKSGKEKYIGAYIIPELDKNKKLIRLYGIAQDISESRKKDEHIINSERQLREAQRIARIGSWVTNYVTEERFWSEELYHIYELNETDITPKFEELTDIIHPLDRDNFNETIRAVMKDLKDRQIVYRIIPKSGKEKYIGAYIIPELDKNNKLIRLYGIAQDISESRKKEEHIINSERQLREAQRIARIGSWVTNYVTEERFWSEELYHIYELDETDKTPKFEELTDIIHPLDREIFNETISKVMNDLQDREVIYRIIPESGFEKYIRAYIIPELDKNRKLIRLYGIAQDISESREKEEYIINSERQLREAQRIARIGSWVTNYVTGERFWSEELYNIYEMDNTGETPKFEEITDIIHPLDRDNFNYTIKSVMEDLRDRQIVYRVLSKTGKEKYIGAYIIPELDEYNKLIRLYGIAQDITENKEKEEHIINSERQLREAQRIARIGSWVTNYATGERFWSEELYNIYEMDMAIETPKFEEITEIIHPDDVENFNNTIHQVMTELKDKQIVYRIIPKKGVEKYVSAYILPELDENKNLLRLYGIAQDITENRKKEEHIINSERQLREAQMIAKIGSFESNYETKQKIWSEEMKRIFELGENEVIPEYNIIANRIHQDDKELFLNEIESQLKDPHPIHITFRYYAKDGSMKYLLMDAIPELAEHRIKRIYGSVQDITEAKEKEQIIINRERQLSEAQKIAKLGSWEVNMVTGESTWSDEMFRIFEIESRDVWKFMDEKVMRSYVYPEDYQIFDKILKNYNSKNPKSIRTTYRLKMESGAIKWVTSDIILEYDKNKKPIRMFGSMQDITQNKEAELLILKREQQLREAQHIAKLGSFDIDVATNHISWSDEMYNIFEIPEKNGPLDTEKFLKMVSKDDRNHVSETFESFLLDPKPLQITYKIVTKNGNVKYLVHDMLVEFDARKKPKRYYGSLQDITTIKEAEEIIRRSQKQLIDAQRIAKIGSFEWLIESNEIYYSDEIFNIYEIERDKNRPSIEDPVVKARVHPDDIPMLEKAGQELLSTMKPIQLYFRYYSHDGSVKHLFAETKTDFNEDGKPYRVYGTIQDITVIKNVEEQLRQTNEKLIAAQQELVHSEKLAALGRFSSGIAHEIRNPLANISALAQLLSRAELEPKLKKHLDFILKNVDIANKIIRDLLDFAQKDDTEFKNKDVINILSDILDLVKTRLESNNIELVKHFESDNFVMPVNEKKLHSTFMNFISNAIEAMPKGGKLIINSKYDEQINRFIISIQDTGMGIPKENLDKIFEPFFTTKDTGSGLGMSIAYQGVQLHKGEIDINSEINKGTNIKIQFPKNNN